jgi:hypothetical protein
MSAERITTEKTPLYRKTNPTVFSSMANFALRYKTNTDEREENASMPTA